MLHGSRWALGLLAVSWLATALLPGCKSDEGSPTPEASAQAERPAPVAPSSQGAPATATAGAASAAERATAESTLRSSEHGLVVTDKAGKETVRLDTTSGKAPADWPSEVPLYPGGKVAMSMKLGRGLTLTLETPDTVAQVREYYKTQLASLQHSSAVDLGKSETLMWSDPGKPLQVTLALNAPGGNTRATLIVTREAARKR